MYTVGWILSSSGVSGARHRAGSRATSSLEGTPDANTDYHRTKRHGQDQQLGAAQASGPDVEGDFA